MPEPGPEASNPRDRMEVDKGECERIFGGIRVRTRRHQIRFCRRVGERGNDPRPLVIGLYSEEERRHILERSRELKNSMFACVTIVPDMTKSQRKGELRLREEAERRNHEDLSEEDREKNLKWIVVGSRGEKRLIKGTEREEQNYRGRGGNPDRNQRATTGENVGPASFINNTGPPGHSNNTAQAKDTITTSSTSGYNNSNRGYHGGTSGGSSHSNSTYGGINNHGNSSNRGNSNYGYSNYGGHNSNYRGNSNNSHGYSGSSNNGYGNNGYSNNGYGNNSHRSNSYGNNGYGNNSYGNNGYGHNGYSNNSYGNKSYGNNGSGNNNAGGNGYLDGNRGGRGRNTPENNERGRGNHDGTNRGIRGGGGGPGSTATEERPWQETGTRRKDGQDRPENYQEREQHGQMGTN